MSEQVLRVLLQLVDQLSGPAGSAAGSLGALQAKAGGAREGLEDVEEGAEDAGEALEKTEQGAEKAVKGINKMMALKAIFEALQKAAALFQESLDRLAEQGDADAIKLKDGMERAQTSLQKVQDNIAKALLPVLNDAATTFNMAAENTEGWGVALMALDPTVPIERVQALRKEIAETNDRLAELGSSGRNIGGQAGEALGKLAEAADTLGDKVDNAALRDLPPHIAGLIQPTQDSGQAAADAAISYGDYAKAIQDTKQAADDLKQAMLDGQTAIMEFGLKFDEAILEPQTVDSAVDLAKGLADAALEAQNLGREVPTSQVQGLRDDAAKLTEALAGMGLTDEQRNILLGWLDLTNQRLLEAERNARLARDAMAGMGQPPPGAGSTAPGGAPIEMQSGGTISEPIIGRGLSTGRTYRLGEQGTIEKVSPVGGDSRRAVQVIQLVVDGRVLAEVVAENTERYRGT